MTMMMMMMMMVTVMSKSVPNKEYGMWNIYRAESERRTFPR
jgi:hypothetical protein